MSTVNYRRRARKKISAYIPDMDRVKKIEHDLYNCAILDASYHEIEKKWENLDFLEIYNNLVLTILNNIDPKSDTSNESFIKLIESDDFWKIDVSKIPPQMMHPEIWKSVVDSYSKQAHQTWARQRKRRMGMYKCPKCHSKNTDNEFMQLAGCDESMTPVGECLDCGKSWGVKRA